MFQYNETPNYRQGSLIVYRPFAGSDRTVSVRIKSEDIKDGRPGFEGDLVTSEQDDSVWGYDYQIIQVVKY